MKLSRRDCLNYSALGAGLFSASGLLGRARAQDAPQTGKQRSPALPNVPTMIEAGYPALDSGAWIGVVVAAGTPAAVIERLNSEVAKAMKDPTLGKIFLDQMIEPVGSTPAAFEAFLRAEHDKWGKVIKDAKLELQP